MIRYSKDERERRSAQRTTAGQRRRVHDHAYLAWLRRAPCLVGLIEGGCHGPVQACHLRMSIPGRPNPGLANKADDAFAWPGCVHHHIEDQHRTSEAAFFRRLGVEPFELCRALYGTFKAGEEPAAAMVGYLAERGIL